MLKSNSPDDLRMLLCAKGVAKPLAMLKYIFDRLGLTLNETKTIIVHRLNQSLRGWAGKD